MENVEKKFISQIEIMRKTGLTRMQLRYLIRKSEDFPKPLPLPGRPKYLLSEVEKVLGCLL